MSRLGAVVASHRRCIQHPYERLIICGKCGYENCPTRNFCWFCQHGLGEFDERCAASWTEKGVSHWTYSIDSGWSYKGKPWRGGV